MSRTVTTRATSRRALLSMFVASLALSAGAPVASAAGIPELAPTSTDTYGKGSTTDTYGKGSTTDTYGKGL